MTAYDARAQAQAGRALALVADGGKGQIITLSRETTDPDNYDPSIGSVMGAFTTTQTGSGLVLDYSAYVRSGIRDEPGSLIQSGDRRLLLSPLNSAGALLDTPKVGDRATASGVTWTITSVATLAPAGTPILHKCNIRGAG